MALAALGAEAATSASPPGEAVQTVAQTGAPVVIKAGTPVFLELVDGVSTRTIKRGDTFALKVALPVKVDGRVVIPDGVPAVGQVVDAGKPGLGGKPAKLVLAARRLEFEGRHIPLRAFFVGGTGSDNTEETTWAVAMVGIAGFLIQGGHVEIPRGTRAKARFAQDFTPAAQLAPEASKPLPPVE